MKSNVSNVESCVCNCIDLVLSRYFRYIQHSIRNLCNECLLHTLRKVGQPSNQRQGGHGPDQGNYVYNLVALDGLTRDHSSASLSSYKQMASIADSIGIKITNLLTNTSFTSTQEIDIPIDNNNLYSSILDHDHDIYSLKNRHNLQYTLVFHAMEFPQWNTLFVVEFSLRLFHSRHWFVQF